MIIINRPFKKEYAKELLEGKNSEGTVYHFIKQDNMKMYFDVSEESERAASVSKIIKTKSELGQVLFNMVEYVK